MTPSTLRLAFGLLAFGVTAAGSATAKNVLSVGPGQAYATPSAAIAAAAPGDVIVVKPSCPGPDLCSYFGVGLGSKSLTLVGEEDASGTRPSITSLVISNLAAGDVVNVRGFRVLNNSQPGPFIQIANNAGTVVVEDVFCQKFGYGTTDLVIDASANVVLTRCQASGQSGGPVFGPPPRPGLIVTNSNVRAFDCVVSGGSGVTIFPTSQYAGAPAVVVDGGSVYFAGGAIKGGAGGPGFATGTGCVDGFPGGAAIHMKSGSPTVLTLGDPLAGGAGGAAPPCGNPGPAGPDYVLHSGTHGAYSEAFRSIEVESPVRTGDLAGVTIEGIPGEAAFIIVNASCGALFVPAWKGLLLPAMPFQMLSVGNIPASGVLQFSVPIPTNVLPPGWQAIDVFAQALVGGQAGSGVLGGPTLLSVLDPAF